MSPLRVETGFPKVRVLGSRLAHGSMRSTDGDEGELNRRKFRELVLAEEYPQARIVMAAVAHDSRVGAANTFSEEIVLGRDALVTRDKYIFAAVTYADCPPVVLFDPLAEVAAAVHCSHHSLRRGVIQNAIKSLKKLGARTQSLHAIVGPGIGYCCYEFTLGDAMKWFGHYQAAILDTKPHVPGKCRLDLRTIIWRQLVWEGKISEKRVQVEEVCTACGNEQLFSFRRERIIPVRAGIFGVMLID